MNERIWSVRVFNCASISGTVSGIGSGTSAGSMPDAAPAGLRSAGVAGGGAESGGLGAGGAGRGRRRRVGHGRRGNRVRFLRERRESEIEPVRFGSRRKRDVGVHL